MNIKKILVIFVLVLVLLGSSLLLRDRAGSSEKPQGDNIKEQETNVNEDNKENEAGDSEDEKEKVEQTIDNPVFFEDEHYLNDKEDLMMRLRGNDFLLGVPYSDNGVLYQFGYAGADMYNVFDLDEIPDQEQAMNEYVYLKDSFPNGLKFKHNEENNVIDLYHGDEHFDTFYYVEELGGR